MAEHGGMTSRPRRTAPRPKPLSATALRAIERRGVTRHGVQDLYYNLMTMPLIGLLGLLFAYFLLVIFVFALVYWLTGGLGGQAHNTFGDAFFFSVQTLSTTGYGTIYPVSLTANSVSTVEMLLGQLNMALATGVLFARLSRPRPRVLFSKVVVLHKRQGERWLMFRVANERRSEISEARMSVVVTSEEEDGFGGTVRKLIPLQLERDFTPVFTLTWQVLHHITPGSPLWGKTREELAASGNVLICALSGTDVALNGTISARYVYGAEDLRFDHRFADVIDRSPEGDVSIDYRRFHDTLPVHPEVAKAGAE